MAKRKNQSDRLESPIQKDILAYLVRCGYLAWRNNQGSMFAVDSHGKERRVRFSTMDGIADLQGIIPRPDLQWGIPFFIEVKKEGKKPTPKQKVFLAAAKKYGAIAFWADSVRMVRDELIANGQTPILTI